MKWLWGDTWKSECVSYQLGRQSASDERSWQEDKQEDKQEKRSGRREAATCYQISIKPVWSPDYSVLLIKV